MELCGKQKKFKLIIPGDYLIKLKKKNVQSKTGTIYLF